MIFPFCGFEKKKIKEKMEQKGKPLPFWQNYFIKKKVSYVFLLKVKCFESLKSFQL